MLIAIQQMVARTLGLPSKRWNAPKNPHTFQAFFIYTLKFPEYLWIFLFLFTQSLTHSLLTGVDSKGLPSPLQILQLSFRRLPPQHRIPVRKSPESPNQHLMLPRILQELPTELAVSKLHFRGAVLHFSFQLPVQLQGTELIVEELRMLKGQVNESPYNRVQL